MLSVGDVGIASSPPEVWPSPTEVRLNRITASLGLGQLQQLTNRHGKDGKILLGVVANLLQ